MLTRTVTSGSLCPGPFAERVREFAHARRGSAAARRVRRPAAAPRGVAAARDAGRRENREPDLSRWCFT